MFLIGIEDAGRGPMVGPLVMAGLKIDESQTQDIKDLGVKDSKLLTPKSREKIFERLVQSYDYSFEIALPSEIDDALSSPNLNLNWLEALKSASIAAKLAKGSSPVRIILDCPSTNTEAYSAYFKRQLKIEAEVIAEHKADVNYPVVSAASIIAKVVRDREIEKIKQDIGLNIGSGYPSDPVTVDFVKKHYKDFPDLIRKTWAPCKKLFFAKDQKRLTDF